MNFEGALEAVRCLQIGQMQAMGSKPVKYIISARRTEWDDWHWEYRPSPCPECNVPRWMTGFAREVTGTVWRCKKHQAFWDNFWQQHGASLVVMREPKIPINFKDLWGSG